MKWFKHESNASESEFIAALEAEFGLEGYARWWKMCEKIADRMDQTDKCYAEYPIEKWMTFLSQKRLKKFMEFLNYCANYSGNSDEIPTKNPKLIYEINGKILRIKIPKMLKLRDNHTKNLQVVNKSDDKLIAPKNKDKDIDIEEEIEKSKKENPPDKKNTERILNLEFQNFWKEYGDFGNEERARKAFKKIKGVDYGIIIEGVKRYQAQCRALGTEPKYIRHASNWLTDKGWKDSYPIPTTEIPNTNTASYYSSGIRREPTAHENFDAGAKLLLDKLSQEQGH